MIRSKGRQQNGVSMQEDEPTNSGRTVTSSSDESRRDAAAARSRRLRLIAATIAVTILTAWDFGQGKRSQHITGERLFSPEELSQYNGQQQQIIYLAVLGTVYDVTEGRKHYGAGGGYSSFAGKDCTRALTGDFGCDNCHDISDLSDLQGVMHWKEFFDKKYKPIGKVVGWYYDSQGRPTKKLHDVEAAADEQEKKQAAEKAEQEKKQAPKWCNVKWTKAAGKEVWCESGRYPRQIVHTNPVSGHVATRCACFDDSQHDEARKLYDGCASHSSSCVASRA